MKRNKRIRHAAHRDEREQSCAYQGRGVVTEVQETDGETAEDDGKVQPGEEGSFVCEKDFRFDARGEGDAFCGSGLEEGLC